MKNNSNGSNLIKVKVFPDSSEEKVIKKGEDEYAIKVKERAENNRANKRVFKILSLIFPEKRIELIKGFKKRNKIFKIYE